MTAIDRLDVWLRISPSTVLPAEVMEYLDDVKTEDTKLRAERDEWHRVAESKQDIIDHMRDANAENAKLRDELDKWERLTANIEIPSYPITEFRPKDLERENDKLRKLAKKLKACNSSCGRCIELYGVCEHETELQELGIELPA